MSWLNDMAQANERFLDQIDNNQLPVERMPCPYAVITCMDPRINLEAIGIPAFSTSGRSGSQVRIIRTVGAMHESRSILIGIHLAGFKEIAILMHTDCGCSLAHKKIDLISTNMKKNLSDRKYEAAALEIGSPVSENLARCLHTFEDPYTAVVEEVLALRNSNLVPESTVVHGLVYDVQSGVVRIMVDGYKNS